MTIEVSIETQTIVVDPAQESVSVLLSGPVGPPGINGVPGATGATGPAGADSTVPGPTGATGPAGADSTVPGPAGADSIVPGPTGATGPAGSAGPTGPTGATGPAGATGPSGAGGTSDPYGLLSNSSAIAADEFDDATIHSDWVFASSGTITWVEKNHKLEAMATSTAYGLCVRPLSSFGGAWSNGVSIVEADMAAGRGKGIVRANFCITDGATTSSNAAQVNYSNNASAPAFIYAFLGTPASVFSGGYTDFGTHPDKIRVRIKSVSSGVVRIQVSYNGNTWFDGPTISIGWTPTHVGYLFSVESDYGMFNTDYIRRIA